MTLFEILGLIVFIIFQLLLIYLISFSRKKAESHFNQSLEKYKSDLIVEVGQKFIEQKRDIDKEISRLQTDLQLIANQRNNFLNQKRDALVEFYSNYSQWLSIILNCYPDDMVFTNAAQIARSYQQKMDEAIFKYEISSATLDLYVQDDELTELRDDVVDITSNLNALVHYYLSDIKDMFLWSGSDDSSEEDEYRRDNILEHFYETKSNYIDRLDPIKKKLQAKITSILNEILK